MSWRREKGERGCGTSSAHTAEGLTFPEVSSDPDTGWIEQWIQHPADRPSTSYAAIGCASTGSSMFSSLPAWRHTGSNLHLVTGRDF